MNRISYVNEDKILETNNNKYLIKNKKTNQELLRYLRSKGFNNYLEPLCTEDNREIYNYINEIEISQIDKSQELVLILALLHNKTTTYENIELDDIKEFYEQIKSHIENTYNYYLNKQNIIEDNIYMAPCEKLLIRNISNIYKLLKFSKKNLDNYYSEISNKKTQRNVQLHNKVTLNNLIKSENSYLINWYDSTRGNVVFDLVTLYKNELLNTNMKSLYKIYQSKYNYTKEEKYLFFTIISISEIVEFNKTNYINTVNTRKLIDYINKTLDFISEEYKEDQKTNEEEFEQ